MSTASLTTRLDKDLKDELERIARFDRRSTSFVANQAIRNLVEERRATRELIEAGLALVENCSDGTSSEEIHAWFLSDEETLASPAHSKK